MAVPFDQDLHYFKQGEVDNLSLGQNGFTVETGTTAVSGNYYCINFLTDTVFTSLTGYSIDGDAITSITFAANTFLLGRFTAFQLASGSVIAYKFKDS